MRNNLIAQRYAQAVIRNVEAEQHQVFNEDMNALKQVFLANKEYAITLNSYLYPLKQRLQLAENITDKLKFKTIWNNLFQILIKKHRFDIIVDLLNSLEYHLLAENNKIKTKLTIAYEHDAEIINKIRKIVEEKLNSEIVAEVVIDPAIIGGFIAETESLRIDGSVHNNLVKLVTTSSKRY